MARKSSADVGFLLLSGMDILGDSTTLEDTREALIEEITALGDTYEQQAYIGVKRFMLTQQGFYNDAANRSNAALVTPGSSKILSYAPEGNAKGSLCVCSGMVQADYQRQIQRGALTKANAKYESEYAHDEAKIVAALAARGAASNTQADSLDGSAQSTTGAVAYLQLTALTLGGYDNIVIKVQDSANNSAFSDIGTFTAITAAPGAQRLVIAGTIRRYLAIAWAYTGSGSNPTATFTVGLART